MRGAGTLVPEDIRWIPARTAGRVEKIVLRAGAQVTPGSVILELSNPDLQQQVRGAELNWKSGQAQLDNRRTDLKQVILNQTAAVKNAEQDFNLAQATLDANEELAKQNLISQVQLKQFRSQLEQARTRLDRYIAESHRLGRDVTRSGLFAALHAEFVQRVEIASPLADVVVDRTQATHCSTVILTHGGNDE